MYKKIDVYYNGEYLWSTNAHKTCKAAKARAMEILKVTHHVTKSKLVKAYFDKRRA
jgi:hypothetical protein